MKYYITVFLFLISKVAFCQNLIVIDSDTKESIIGAELISCETLKSIGTTNISGEADVALSELSNNEIRVQYLGYLSKLIILHSDSIQVIELQVAETAMTLGGDMLKMMAAQYEHEIANSCPNEIVGIKGRWQSDCAIQVDNDFLFEISFFGDTVITIQNHSGLSKSFSKHFYEISNDTIHMYEVEHYTVDTNVGYVKSHYINRGKKSTIPLCIFRNNCPAENGLAIFPRLKLISQLNLTTWIDITQSDLYEKSKQVERNY